MLILVIVLLMVLFIGEPDVFDYLVVYLKKLLITHTGS
jgi:hypothetical protein